MRDPERKPPVSVLVVDDDRICRHGVRRALRKADLPNPVYEARDGIEALGMLRCAEGYDPVQRPFTILLDLNMPQMDGHQFLHELRADPELHDANVFVMSTSASRDDVRKSYDLNVAGYVTKSGDTGGFSDLATMLGEYWRVVTLI